MVRPGTLSKLALFGLAAAITWSCTDSGSSEVETPLPTAIVLQPIDFRGVVPCSATGTTEAGKIGSYQATLIDVTEGLQSGTETFTLPSSNIVPCEQAVVFMFVVPGHSYIAQVDAFERRDLKARSPGLRQVVASSEPSDGTGQSIPPTWTTTCYGSAESLDAVSGGGAGGGGGVGGAGGDAALGGGGLGGSGTTSIGVMALPNAQLPVRGCQPLTAPLTSTP
jgi:hypothetical protein